MLIHFNPLKPMFMKTDASYFAISGILYHTAEDSESLQPVAFYSRKLSPAEQNYPITDKELLAIVCSLTHWRCYLEGANYPITVYSDHSNLLTFTTTKQLNRRQARWSQELGAFDFVIKHISGVKNQRADLLSRRHDYQDFAKTSNTKALLDSSKLIAASLRHANITNTSEAEDSDSQSTSDDIEETSTYQDGFTPSNTLLRHPRKLINSILLIKELLNTCRKRDLILSKLGCSIFQQIIMCFYSLRIISTSQEIKGYSYTYYSSSMML